MPTAPAPSARRRAPSSARPLTCRPSSSRGCPSTGAPTFFQGGVHPVPVSHRPEALHGRGRVDGPEEDRPGRSPRRRRRINVALSPEFDPRGGQSAAKGSQPAPRDPARVFAEAAGAPRKAMPAATRSRAHPRRAARHSCSAGTHPEALRSGEMSLFPTCLREIGRRSTIDQERRRERFRALRAAVSAGRVCGRLAARKAAKLRGGSPADDSGTRTMAGADRRRRVQRSVPRAEAEPSASAKRGERALPAVERTGQARERASPAPTAEEIAAGAGILGVLLLSGAAALFLCSKAGPAATARRPG